MFGDIFLSFFCNIEFNVEMLLLEGCNEFLIYFGYFPPFYAICNQEKLVN